MAEQEHDSVRYIRRWLLLWLLALSLPAALVFAVDPYQVFHRSWLPRTFFYKDNERYQVAGLIKQYLGAAAGYDSIAIGTSMSSNFSSQDMDTFLGWRALNFSIRASSLSERLYVLDKALATGKVKHVLFEVFADDFQDSGESVDGPHSNFPYYLYTPAWRDKQHYLFNVSVLQAAYALLGEQGYLNALPVAWRTAVPAGKWVEGVPRLADWSVWLADAERNALFARYNTPESLATLSAKLAQARQAQAAQQWAWRADCCHRTADLIRAVVRAHPEVDFRIWLAAASLNRYASDANMDYTNQNVEIRRHLIRTLADEPNVQLFGFDNDLAITADLHNYMDTVHFTRTIEQTVLRAVASGQYRLAARDADVYADTFRSHIEDFSIVVPPQRQNTK